MKKEEFDKLYEVLPTKGDIPRLFRECIDYNWSLINVKEKATEYETIGCYGMPWNEQGDASKEVYFHDVAKAPIFPKTVLYEATLSSEYSLDSADDVKGKLLNYAQTPLIRQHELFSPIYLRMLTPRHANALLSLGYQKIQELRHMQQDGHVLPELINSKQKELKKIRNHTLWDVYNATMDIFNERAQDIALAFNCLYAHLIQECVEHESFRRIETHTHQGVTHEIWGSLGFRIPPDKIKN